MSDIVYNFHHLQPNEMNQFSDPSKYAIHFTTYTTEGRTYVPWMMNRLHEHGAQFVRKHINSFEELGDSFDIIINCAGINGGRLSGDDNTVIPIRGILIEVDAPWHKHFLYRDLVTISIPTTNSLFVGTVKQNNRNDMIITDDDRIDIWGRLLKLIPTLKDAKVINEWIGLRPERNPIRLESQWRQSHNGRRFQLVHNYGHGGNGFTLSWGCAMQVVQLIGDNIDVSHRSSSGNVISRL